MKKPAKCQDCREREATWAMQYIGEDKPSFYALGWHIRGFSIVRLCDNCKQKHEAE